MKTVLIVGGFGFLATNIIKYIDEHLSDDYQVVVFDKFAQHPHGVVFSSVKKVYAGDFSDEMFINSIFKENHIDLVIHALSTTVPALSLNARYDIESNLLPTINLFDIMVRHNVNDIVYISSGGAVYGKSMNLPYREDMDVMPISSYGIVKLTIEKYLHQYSELNGLRSLILRLSNPYGPYHYSMKQGICNVAMRKAVDNETFEVWGTGDAKKDFIFVTDFVDILFRLLSKNISGEVFNIGSGEVVSVNSILSKIKKIDAGFKWINKEASQYDVQHFELDLTKLRKCIGDYPFTKMDDGLDKTYKWLKKNKDVETQHNHNII